MRAHPRVFVSHVVLAEAAWVLASSYRLSREAVREVIETLVETQGIELEDPTVVKTALAHHRASPLQFADCLVLAIAERAGETPLATFDRGLGRLAGARTLGGRSRRT